jgi:hypothetical protein
MTWAANHDASLDKLRMVQGSLTVGLIMVHRRDFLTCSPEDIAAEVKCRNAANFSFLPVVECSDRIVGLYDAERWFDVDAPETPIGNDFLPLSEDIVIGADASIFDFIRKADEVSTKLVVSGDGVAGLVSLSDIQQLPVRAALFALVTSLEMAMSLAIERRWPNPENWMAHLSDGRRSKLADEIAKARQRDGFVSEIAFTQISDKADLICKGGMLSGSRRSRAHEFVTIRELRDNLAHANSYAETPEEAKRVCQILRSVYQLKDELLKAVEDQVAVAGGG